MLYWNPGVQTTTTSTDGGHAHESRALQRKPIFERWDAERLAGIKVTPWSMRVTDAAVRVEMGAEVDGHPPPVPDAVPEARRVKITMKVLRERGYTASCKQCDRIRSFSEHRAGIAHSEVCRQRIMAAMVATIHGAARLGDEELRVNRHLAERIERADAERAQAPEAVVPLAPPSVPLDNQRTSKNEVKR